MTRPRSSRQHHPNSSKGKGFRPAVEPLEAREVPTLVSWLGAAGDQLWTTPGNWDAGRVPGPADDVRLDVPGDTPVRFSASDLTVRLKEEVAAHDVSDYFDI